MGVGNGFNCFHRQTAPENFGGRGDRAALTVDHPGNLDKE